VDDIFDGLTFICGGCDEEIECTGEITVCPHCNTSNVISQDAIDEIEEAFGELMVIPPVIPNNYNDYSYIADKIAKIKKEIKYYKTSELVSQINLIQQEQSNSNCKYVSDELNNIIETFELYGWIDDRGLDVLEGSFIVSYLFEGEALNKKDEAC